MKVVGLLSGGKDSCYNSTTVTCGHCYRTTVAATSPTFINEVWIFHKIFFYNH